jgi:hypothetical protein
MLNNKSNKVLMTLSAVLMMTTYSTSSLATESFTQANDVEATPYISAGNSAGDTNFEEILEERIDENTSTSDFTGVVSINPVIDGVSYICTGTAISSRHILTAAHCVDSDGNGNVMDLSEADNAIAVVFNDDGAYYDDFDGSVIYASDVVINPDYDGFNICSDGSSGCVNDDVAVITLDEDIPAGVEIYDLYTDSVAVTGSEDGDTFTMVGYGTRGDGYWGYYSNYDDSFTLGLGSPTFDEKLVGANIVDYVELDDEADFVDGTQEVWYADFDGYDSYFDEDIDSFCNDFGICSTVLDESIETNIGGGDSGGPSFIYDALNDKYWLAAINTFGIQGYAYGIAGAFGDIFGGILLESYVGWINSVVTTVADVSAPSVVAIMLLAAFGIGARRRRA